MLDGRGSCAASVNCGLMGCRRCDERRALAWKEPRKDPPVDAGPRFRKVTALRLLGVTLRKFQPGRAR